MMASALATAAHLISGAAVEWHCDPHAGVQRIYFANHSSHLDFIVIWSALPAKLRRVVRPVAGRDYWQRSAVRRYVATRVFHALLVDRAHADADPAHALARASVARMAQEMGDTYSLIVFPEGTRSVSGEVGSFKSGLYHLARLRPDVELVPVHLENLNRILPKGEALPVPMLSRVVFGLPFTPSPQEDKHEFLAHARRALIQLRSTQ
jgi:1-acyl-sn-glycerol-3-phosphate acyltransferase